MGDVIKVGSRKDKTQDERITDAENEIALKADLGDTDNLVTTVEALNTGQVAAVSTALSISETYATPGTYDASSGSVTIPFTIASGGTAATWSNQSLVLNNLGGAVNVAADNTDADANPDKILDVSVADSRYTKSLNFVGSTLGNSDFVVTLNPNDLGKGPFTSIHQLRVLVYYQLQSSSGRAGYYEYYYQRFSSTTVNLLSEFHQVNSGVPTVSIAYVSNTTVTITVTNNFSNTGYFTVIVQ